MYLVPFKRYSTDPDLHGRWVSVNPASVEAVMSYSHDKRVMIQFHSGNDIAVFGAYTDVVDAITRSMQSTQTIELVS